MSIPRLCRVVVAVLFVAAMSLPVVSQAAEPAGYADLVKLFAEWRAFERPVMHGAVPDYSRAAMAEKAAELPAWQKRLDAIATASWPVEQRNDWKLVKAEMNGFDFNLRVLKPWGARPGVLCECVAGADGCSAARGAGGFFAD